MSQENVKRAYRVPVVGIDTTRQQRTLEEQLFVRVPALARAFAHALARLPKGSRLRRLFLARRAGQAASAVYRRDFDVLFLGFDPEIDFQVVSAGHEGMVVPNLIGHHHGHAGYLDVWREMLEGFEDMTLEPEEDLLDLGEQLMSVTRMKGHGSSSGAPISQLLFQVFTFRRGLIVKQEDFGTREEALEAVGLRE